MKISALAKVSNLTPSTIRYYINQGLLLPKKVNNQYCFTDEDAQTLYYINMWKNMGFSIQEIEHLTSLKRLSNWIAIEDYMYYYNILEARKQALLHDLKHVRQQLEMVDEELGSMRRNELYNWECAKHEPRGLPLCCLDLLVCAVCQSPLYLQDAHMNYKYIDNCKLRCKCGYEAVVENGVFSGGEAKYDEVSEKPDLLRAKYKNLSKDLSTLFQRTSNWLFPYFNHNDHKPKVILETHLNSFFLLNPYLKSLNSGDTLILADRHPGLLSMYKRNIELLDLDLNVVYIVNHDNALPIRAGSVDIMVDYCSSNNFNQYSQKYFLPLYRQYLHDDSLVLGTYYSFENAPHSMRALKNTFPKNHPDNYKLSFFKQSVADVFSIEKLVRIGYVTDSGDCCAFDFHQRGEKLCADCFLLRVKG